MEIGKQTRRARRAERELRHVTEMLSKAQQKIDRLHEQLPTHNVQAIENRDECEKCGGSGWVYYPNASTWREEKGPLAPTWGICNQCWGSGLHSTTWPSWEKLGRVLTEEQKRLLGIDF